MNRSNGDSLSGPDLVLSAMAGVAPVGGPDQLPPAGSPERWPWLQGLRRAAGFDLEPWLQAIEGGGLVPAADLLAVLAERLDGPAAARLLAWWLAQPDADPALLAVIGRLRHPSCRRLLLEALDPAAAGPDGMGERHGVLLPLLGHQRHPDDFPLLLEQALAPLPLRQRRAALEGLAVGLAVWPLQPLRQGLRTLVGDLDPALAATAVDLLARLPGGREDLAALAREPLAAELLQRVRRRLAGPGAGAPDGSS